MRRVEEAFVSSPMIIPGLPPTGAAQEKARAADKHTRQGAEQPPDRAWSMTGNGSFSPSHHRQLLHSLLHAPCDQAEEGRKRVDDRLTWRDAVAQLFCLSKREHRWKCALFMLFWKIQTAQLTSQNLAVARFQRRKRKTDCKAHLLAWWAVVLLRQRSFSSVVGTSDCSEEDDAACSTNGSAKHQVNAAEHAANGPHSQNTFNSLELQAADLKIIQRCRPAPLYCAQRVRQQARESASATKRQIVFHVHTLCSALICPLLCIDLVLGGKVGDYARAQPGERY